MFNCNPFRLALRVLSVLLLSLSVVRVAYAQSGGVDVTNDVKTAIDGAIFVVLTVALYLVRAYALKLTGVQISASDMQVVQAFLDQAAHSWVNSHLLNGGPITLQTKSQLGDQLLRQAQGCLPDVMQRLGVSKDAVAALAQGAVAKALNLTPSAPPYAPAAQ